MKVINKILILGFTFVSLLCQAQIITGDVNYEALGIKLTIPESWKGQESENGLLIGHDTEPGMIIITTNNYKSYEQAQQEARTGIQDGDGTNLMISGSIDDLEGNGIGAEYQGTMQWEPAKLYAVALINSKGYGITIMAGTTINLYSEKYKNLALEIARSTVFSEPKTGPIVKQWNDWLSNKRLTYMKSDYSSGPSIDGYSSGSGYSSTVKIDLCKKGYFNYSSSSDVSVSSSGASAYGDSQNAGNGNWKIMGNAQGGATLILSFNNGEVYEYVLTYEEEKTYLNGERYFVTDETYNQEDAPQCY